MNFLISFKSEDFLSKSKFLLLSTQTPKHDLTRSFLSVKILRKYDCMIFQTIDRMLVGNITEKGENFKDD